MRIALFLVFLAGFSVFSQDVAPPPVISIPNTAPKIEVQIIHMCSCGQETHYARGSAAFDAFVKRNVSFPSDMNWGNFKQSRIYVQFIVERDGSLSNIHILHTNFPEANEYILAAFAKMTNWVAGEIECKAVRTRVRVPVSLVLR